MEAISNQTDVYLAELFHRAYNLEEKHNIGELPSGEAVFGIFAAIDEQPVNCRYIAITGNLQSAVKALFEKSAGNGLEKFMQGPWSKLLQYKPVTGYTPEEKQQLLEEWNRQYKPGIDEAGNYPGYYE